jgi:hypothetical protein
MPYQETPYQKFNIVDADGNILSGISSSSSGGGDASAENQATEIAKLTSIDNKATSDPATGNKQDEIIQLLKGWKLLNGYNLTSSSSNETFIIDTIANNCNTFALAFEGLLSEGTITFHGALRSDSSTATEEISAYSLNTLNFEGSNLSETSVYICRCNSPFFIINTSDPWIVYNNLASLTIYKFPVDLYEDIVSSGINNQQVQLNILVQDFRTTIQNSLGIPNSTVATNDLDGNSLISLFKRLLSVKLGEDITGTTIPIGGTGIRGLLSWIAKLISDRIGTSNTAINTPLAANATYTSSALPTANLNKVRGWVFANQSGTLFLEFSRDSTSWRVVQTINYTANNVTTFEQTLSGVYYRLRYLNGTTAQTTFELLFTQMGFGT